VPSVDEKLSDANLLVIFESNFLVNPFSIPVAINALNQLSVAIMFIDRVNLTQKKAERVVGFLLVCPVHH
jgi:hypothetical protein